LEHLGNFINIDNILKLVVDMLVETDSVCSVKYHVLGNDYLFLDASKFTLPNVAGIKKFVIEILGWDQMGFFIECKLMAIYFCINP
jgi:hypothetical protein